MIDYFAIALTHGLILYLCWRLLNRDDLDDPFMDPPAPKPARAGRKTRRRKTAGRSDA